MGRRPGFRGGLDAHQPPAFAWFPSPPGSAGLLGGGCITPRTLVCPRRRPSRSPRWDRRTGQWFGYCCRCRDPGSASASHGDFSSALGKPVPVFPHPARSLGSRWLKARGVCAASRCDRDEGRCAALQAERHRPVPGAEQRLPPCTAARGGMQLRPPSPLQWLCICVVKAFPPAGRPVPAAPQPRRAPASCSPALPGQAVGA